jgi:hypothetical protein
VAKEKRSVLDECGSFEIDVVDSNIENKQFNTNLKLSLIKKFNLISDRSDGERKDKKLCALSVKTSKNEYSVATSTSGTISRKNNKINISYSLRTSDNKIIEKDMIIFYGVNVSSFSYSNHVKEKKTNVLDAEKVAEKVFFDVVNALSSGEFLTK